MSKEKQIDNCCYDCIHYLACLKNGEYLPSPCSLYDDKAGYRKQSEGEWHYNPDGMDWGLGAWQCSVCGCKNDNLPMDEDIKPLQWAGTKYCPNCGTKMKGGAE